MRLQRWMQRAIPLAAVTLLGAAPALIAQGQQLFEWSGRVDRERQIVMRGSQISTNNIGQTEPGRVRVRTMSMLPRENGQVVVQLLNGRGRVDVIQQPSPQNGFTTVVRVQDPQSGSDDYRIAAYWQGYSGGVYGGRRDRDDRDRDDRDRGYNNGVVYPNGGNAGVYPNAGNNGVYQNRGYGAPSMLHWSGNVDDEIEIRIQNGRMSTRTIRGQDPTSIRANYGDMGMPSGNARVAVVQHQGRGSVTVTQQPGAWNGYTTVLRVRDPQGGYGFYDFDLIWQ